MIDILIIEDEQIKMNKIRTFILSLLPESNVRFQKSYRSGLKDICENKPNLIILDMTIPTFDVAGQERGGRLRPYGGRDILYEMRRRRLSSKVIVLTGFESFGEPPNQLHLNELKEQLAKEFTGNYVDTIFYQANVDWESKLADTIKGAIPT